MYVSRRYGDFKTLYNEVGSPVLNFPFPAHSPTQLRKAHPDEDIRPPPAKDRTYGSSRAPLSPTVSNTSTFLERPESGSNDSLPLSPTPTAAPSLRLAREKNRLTLRAYLHTLISSITIASSPVIRSFLLSDPTTLSDEELEDALRREEADRTRDEGRKQFAREISARVDSLRGLVKSVKGDLLGKGQIPPFPPGCIRSETNHSVDGLTRTFEVIKTTDNVRGLPSEFQAVIEWGRISSVTYSDATASYLCFIHRLASTVFHHFIAADDASESLAGLKRIHGYMPYFMLKAALKISNPVAMIRSAPF